MADPAEQHCWNGNSASRSTLATPTSSRKHGPAGARAAEVQMPAADPVTFKEKFLGTGSGTGSGNLSELEGEINKQASKGHRLHTITTASAKGSGFGGGDRIQGMMVLEKLA